MEDLPETLTIGALAKASGVHVETIRFYQQRGLLPRPPRPQGGIRRYGRQDVARLRFIKAAQRLGFSLDEIGELLKLEDGAHCREAAKLAAARLSDVRARIADLRRMERALARLLTLCEAGGGRIACPLIAALQG